MTLGRALGAILVALLAVTALLVDDRRASTRSPEDGAPPAAAPAAAALDARTEAAPRAPTGELRAPDNGTKLGAPVPFTTRPVSAPADRTSMLRLPDGRYVPALNGVDKPRAMIWKHGDFTPIIATERTRWRGIGELEWYVHRDGTRSTTWKTGVDGKPQAVTIVLHATRG